MQLGAHRGAFRRADDLQVGAGRQPKGHQVQCRARTQPEHHREPFADDQGHLQDNQAVEERVNGFEEQHLCQPK